MVDWSVTSSANGWARGPISAATAAQRARSRPLTRTVFPKAASCSAMARPMPRLAPVTRAIMLQAQHRSRRGPTPIHTPHRYRTGMDRGSGADRIETRELAYFVAVAETCHFGRAAQRLGIAQPPLSRAIRRLERRLGVVLLERTSRRVALTMAGEVLLAEGRRALDTIDTAVARARAAARLSWCPAPPANSRICCVAARRTWPLSRGTSRTWTDWTARCFCWSRRLSR